MRSGAREILTCVLLFVALVQAQQAQNATCQIFSGMKLTTLILRCYWIDNTDRILECITKEMDKLYFFRLLHYVTSDNNGESHCASLMMFTRKFSNVDYKFGVYYDDAIKKEFYSPPEISILFNKELPTAKVVLPKVGNQMTEDWIKSSLTTVHYPREFAISPQVRRKPNEAEYWNFSSPKWRENNNWWTGFSIKDVKVRMEFLQNIQNTSLESFSFVQNDTTATSGSRCNDFQLPYLPRLKKLYVDCATMKNFSEENFQSAPELEELKLKWNDLTEIPATVAEARNLRVLDLSDNGNMTANFFPSSSELSKLPYLHTINLSGSTLVNLSNPIPFIPKLRVLNISRCGLTEVNKTAFVNLKSLEVLDLSENRLTHINSEFPKSLRVLLLKGNNISLFSVIWNPNQVLDRLDISSNNLRQFPLFEPFIKIKTLDISSNTINEMTTPNCEADILNLSFNTIKNWTKKEEFSFLRKELNISNNDIPFISEEMRLSLDHLEEVDLEGNTFQCHDCRIKDLKDLIAQEKPRIARELTCYLPEYKRGSSVQTAICEELTADMLTGILIHLSTVLIVSVLLILVMYRYRFELVYMLHLYKMRISGKKDSSDALYDAFVCYSGHDRAWVLGEFAPMLEAEEEKYRLCLHDRDFLLGSHIQRNIVHSIDRSRRTIIVLSQQFVISRWCQWELDMANHKMFEESRNFLVLLERERLDRTVLPRHLKYLMDTRTYLEWPKDPNAGEDAKKTAINRLKEALGPSISQKKGNERQRLQDVVELL